MSFRTLGTSAKKKRAKMPAAAPKPAAMPPLFGERCWVSVRDLDASRTWEGEAEDEGEV
jgi:hypothetical protein